MKKFVILLAMLSAVSSSAFAAHGDYESCDANVCLGKHSVLLLKKTTSEAGARAIAASMSDLERAKDNSAGDHGDGSRGRAE
jgi:hypothetical protein